MLDAQNYVRVLNCLTKSARAKAFELFIKIYEPKYTKAAICLQKDHDGMFHLLFKLGQCAEKKWRRLRGFDYLTKVITGVKFKDGVEVTEFDLVAAWFRRQNTTSGNNPYG